MARVSRASTVAPVDDGASAPGGKQSDAEFAGERSQSLLADADPLSAVIDEDAVVLCIRIHGQQPTPDSIPRLKNRDLRAFGFQRRCRAQTRQPCSDYCDIARYRA